MSESAAVRDFRHRRGSARVASAPQRASERDSVTSEDRPSAGEVPAPVRVVIDGVTKRVRRPDGERVLFDGLSVSVPEGERLAVLGPNGSGKTSLVEMVLGLDRVESGSVALTTSSGPARVAYIPQDYRHALLPWLSVGANLALSLDGPHRNGGSWLSLGPADRERFRELTCSLGLELDLGKYPYQLSGGEQQTLVLLQALLRRPGLVVADEPLSALDAHLRELALTLLRDGLQRDGSTLLIASNQVDDAVLLADSVMVLSPGRGGSCHVVRVATPHPRPLEWRQSAEYQGIVRLVMAELAS